MSRKITQIEFLHRFTHHFPNAKIEIIQYISLKKPCIIKCSICQKIHKKSRAEGFLSSWNCCEGHNESGIEKIKRLCKENGHYQFIKQVNGEKIVIKHLNCGNEIIKSIQGAINAPCACLFCETQKQKSRLSLDEAQKQLDEHFGNNLTILTFDGVDSKQSKYRCNNCGLIFNQSYYNLLTKCRGCPKCDQRRSKGEKAMSKILEKSNIPFKTQVRFPEELGKLSFDFAILNNNNEIIGLIEIQGDQHYHEVFRYHSRPDYFKTQIAHDEQKRNWCKNKNIPLYEIYNDCGKLKNLDILPFISSTTIPIKGSTL